MIGLSRRELLYRAPFAIAGGLEALSGCSIPIEREKKKITFQEALQNINLRPSYLKQIVDNHYFQEVVYGHEGSIAQSYGVSPEKIKDAFAMPLYFDYQDMKFTDFGRERKPTLIVFRKAFETTEIKLGNKSFEFPPSEQRLLQTLEHEYFHAEDIYRGIDLGNGLTIDNSNYLDIKPNVREFVMETRAYIHTLNLVRNFLIDLSKWE